MSGWSVFVPEKIEDKQVVAAKQSGNKDIKPLFKVCVEQNTAAVAAIKQA